jgi:hypothetical protein
MTAVVVVMVVMLVAITLQGGSLSSRPGVIQRRRNRKTCQHWSSEGRPDSRTLRCIACGQRQTMDAR